MSGEIFALWVYLSADPLLWLTVTLLAFLVAQRVHERLRQHPLTNPVVVAIVLLMVILLVTGTPYGDYFAGAQFVHFLLGPATVSLAVPLYDQRRAIRTRALPLALTSLAGIITAVVSTLLLGLWLGGSRETIMSLAPKSVTSPVAMGIAEQTGGLPSLTAGLVLVTGMIGATAGVALFRLVRVTDPVAQGFSLGLGAHGFGTAQAFAISPRAGAFAGLALGLSAVITALALPLLVGMLGI